MLWFSGWLDWSWGEEFVIMKCCLFFFWHDFDVDTWNVQNINETFLKFQ
jgi:hypothetical protein